MDYQSVLLEIFTDKTLETINNIIRIVEENSNESEGIKLEMMVDLLSLTGNNDNNVPSNEQEFASGIQIPEQLDEAAGVDWNLVNRTKTREKQSDALSRLIDVLPDADPLYLEQKAKEIGDTEEELQNFITNAIDTEDYPTREEYLKRNDEKIERQQYTTYFHLYEFLKEFPDPFEFFEDPNRKHALSNSEQENKEQEIIERETQFALTYLFNIFGYVRKPDIVKLFRSFKYDVVKIANKLRKIPPSFKERRPFVYQEEDLETNVLLLKELAFVKHADEIQRILNVKKENIAKAKELGILQSCSICYFDELVPEECYICSNECIFCRDCIKRGIGIVIGEEKLEMGCLSGCGGDFSLTTLQMVLDRKTFTHFWQKKQLHEIEKAEIDGVEFCCLCYKFAYIPNPDDKIFSCEACNRDSCRQCKHESHIPLKCNEIEYDEDVKMRTFIENKMTEALVRKCHKCQKIYIKNSGCNKIQCNCGALMCYICNAVIKDYSHFGEGKCPLFTDDNLLHLENVKNGAVKAKAELGIDKNPDILKFDPAKDL